MKALLLLITIPLLISALSLESSFSSWASFNGKQYKTPGEYSYRLGVYSSNLNFIEDHNRKNLGFILAMNEFGDLTSEEFGSLYLATPINVSLDEVIPGAHEYNPLESMADTVDWRTKGAVTSPKNQGQCGSCWAFSTTGSVEGAWKIKKGALVSLSEQNLVDCSKSYGNHGCNGGLMDQAFKYIIANKGVDKEQSYPYTGKDGTCKFNSANVGATLSSFKDVAKSEQSLASAIQVNPVSIAIDASHQTFQFYKSGIYYEPACSSTKLDHGVLAVGYGSQSGDYYIVKNSWGTSWGMQGYILMARNKNNNCGVASSASYPVV